MSKIVSTFQFWHTKVVQQHIQKNMDRNFFLSCSQKKVSVQTQTQTQFGLLRIPVIEYLLKFLWNDKEQIFTLNDKEQTVRPNWITDIRLLIRLISNATTHHRYWLKRHWKRTLKHKRCVLFFLLHTHTHTQTRIFLRSFCSACTP